MTQDTMAESEKIFYDKDIDRDSSCEELKDVYVEHAKLMLGENPMSWITLPDSTLFVASYAFRLISNYVKQSHSSILDVGSGLGAQLFYWKAKGFDRVEGCDIAPHFATDYINRGIPYKLVDLNCKDLVLPYKDNEFDIVTCSHTLEHLKYPDIVVEELVRVSNDIVIISGPLGKSYYSKAHIQFWYSAHEVAQSLLKKDWVFSIEYIISSILKDITARITPDGDAEPVIKQIGFLAVIYKRFSPDSPGCNEWMWGDDEIIKKLRESRTNTFLFLSTEDDLFSGEGQ
jgi:ubiquinone/menaquinone biosynthesis C-methylase UbiE